MVRENRQQNDNINDKIFFVVEKSSKNSSKTKKVDTTYRAVTNQTNTNNNG